MPQGSQSTARFNAFAALHRKGTPLLLIDIWDVASAKAMLDGGAVALATSSGALAASQGFADGENLPFDDLLRVVERISSLSDTPLTVVDIEAGYGDTPAAIASNLRRIVDTGATGVNIEDGLRAGRRRLIDVAAQAERLAAARATAPGLFINARIDTYLLSGSGGGTLLETRHRAMAYSDAGADGIFIPGISDVTLIHELAGAIDAPLNVLATPTMPSLTDLAAAGVARISLGGWPLVASLKHLRGAAAALVVSGDFASFE